METLVHYINPAHTISLLGMLNDQRLIGQFCDVVLVVGGQRFQAHRTVLAASSEYFQSLFMKKDSEVHSTVQLDFCESHTFETVLNYIYTSSLFVDQTSLAAIQELGCSLGITFLTKIMSKKPQVSYSVSRKRVSFSEDDDNSCQQKSVIVCRSDRLGASVSRAKVLNPKGKMSSEQTQQTVELPSLPLKEPHKSLYCYQPKVNSTVPTNWKSVIGIIERGPDNHYSPSESLSKKTGAMLSTRPPLTSSVSFSESEIQHNRILTDTTGLSKEQQPALSDHKQVHLDRDQETGQQEKSSPLIKRSLSMDSPIPIFSPALEPVVRTATERPTDAEPSEPEKPKAVQSLVLPSKHCNADGETEAHKAEVHVKTEPSSPLADPSDIIRVTVGENWPINLRDFPMSLEDAPRGFFVHSGKDRKRKARLESRRGMFKRCKGLNDHDLRSHKDNRPSPAVCHSNVDGTDGQNEPRQRGTFKCWDCLKVFQSDTGLHRHVNMFHNPEKPYSCDICHKRFPTNFKVWTHQQTQHGVTQNVVPSSGAYTVTGERAQRKLVGAVQERAIKRSLMIKLKGNKPGSLPPQTYSKRCLRTRSIIHTCPHCGKMFWCSSAQFRLHLNLHARESLDRGAEAKDGLPMKREEVVNLQEDVSKEGYSCRLCDERLASLSELGDSDGECRHSTVCPYCGLRFSSQSVKKEHEAHCEYKKLTCLECMRTFKSSFSIWRHQVEVHNQNTMTTKGSPSLCFGDRNSEPRDESPKPTMAPVAKLDSEASPLTPNEQSGLQCPDGVRVKEEPKEEAVDNEPKLQPENPGPVEPSLWSCEKCGKLFGVREQLERHQELLCYIKPFICHVCHKAFRTNFRLWSHFQSHTSSSEKPRAPDNNKRRPSSPSPSPPPAPHLPMPNPSPPAAKAERSLSVNAPVNTELTGPAGGLRSRKSMSDKCPSPRESATLIYHAPALSTLTFKKQLMCKFCHRTFKTAFSLWSHEQSHNNH